MWFALIWPALTILLLIAIPVLRRKTVWWEYALPWLPCVILIPSCSAIGESWQTSDTERLAGYATEVRYYEDWDEYVRKTCTRQVACGRDNKGNTKYCTETYDCSYVDYHPEYWEIRTTVGSHRITRDAYNQFKSWWGGQRVFVNMHRDYHWNDGDMYKVVWDKNPDTLEPAFTTHSYENRTQAAHSVYEWLEIDPQESPVYEWPGVSYWKSRSILGPLSTPEGELKLGRLNSRIGPENECQVLLCTWKGQPMQVGFDQQHYWKGGNKNELVICVSVDDAGRPEWSHVFSWMDNQTLSYDVRDFVLDQEKFDPETLTDYLAMAIPKKWKRKEFSAEAEDGGFSMIQIDAPTWMYWVVHILSFAASAGVGSLVVLNEVES